MTAAKRLLRGVVGIDAEAGPTEIGILADDSADPDHVAADLISQAEHDELAACLLVSPSEELLDAVWGHDSDIESRTVDVHIRRLRKALNEGGHKDLVRTVRAAGYALDQGVNAA